MEGVDFGTPLTAEDESREGRMKENLGHSSRSWGCELESHFPPNSLGVGVGFRLPSMAL